MIILYTIGILLYRFIIIVVSPFNGKAKKWLNGRKDIISKLKATTNGYDKIAWFHCSSLGEFEQGRTVMEAFRKQYNDYKILLTFFSPSGYEVRKNYEAADWVFYLPLDTHRNAKRFIAAVNPTIAIFVKYEFWYYYLTQLKRKGVNTYLASAVFRSKQAFFKWYGGFFRKMLTCYKLLFVQNQQSVELLNSINITNTFLAGDTRFDRVYELAQNATDIPILTQFCSNAKLTLIAGSTWHEDEVLLADYFASQQNLKLIIAPHEVENSRIERLQKQLQAYKTIRYTEVSDSTDLTAYNVLIIDTIGLLMSAYRYGDISYVGGGFGSSGIHNTLEPATFGIPVVFGPIYDKFKEAVELVEAGGAFSAANQQELTSILNKLITNNDLRVQCGNICKAYVEQKRGATKAILSNISA